MTNSQAAAHESWLARCSPCTPAFSQSNLHDINHGRQPILLPWDMLVIKFLPQLPTHLTLVSWWAQPQQISTQALPIITTQPQQFNNKNLLYHINTFTTLLLLGKLADNQHLLHPRISPSFLLAYINTTHNDGSKYSAMVARDTDTFTTTMQPYLRQPHLSRGSHSFHRTITHGESQSILISSPQTAFSHISLFQPTPSPNPQPHPKGICSFNIDSNTSL